MRHDPRSIHLNKSLAANDEQVPIRALFNPADVSEGNHSFELIADKAVEPCAGPDPQNAIAGAVKRGDLIAHARSGVIEDGQGSVESIQRRPCDADEASACPNP